MRTTFRFSVHDELLRPIRALLLVPLLLLAAFGAGTRADDEQRPQGKNGAPVPEAAELAKAEKAIHDLFKDEFASDKVGDQRALAKRLLLQAQDATNDAASRYVLYREARDVAAKSGDLSQAWLAVDEMAKSFDINVPAQKLPPLQAVAPAITSPASNENLVAAIVPIVEAAMRLDDFDTAEKLLKVADNAARITKSVSRAKSVSTLNAALGAARTEHAKAKKALEVLAARPDDAEANLTVGRYQCFYKEDWAAGLPRLAQGSDATLKALAEKTLADGVDDSTILADIAGGWWDAAEKLPEAERLAVRRYSADRYRLAWPRLSGLKKELAEKRIAEGSRRPDRRVYNLIPLIDISKDVLHGTWRIDKNELHCDSTHFVPRVQIPYRPPEEYDYVVVFSQPKLRNGIFLIMPNKHGGSFFWTVSSEGGTACSLSVGGGNASLKLPPGNVILPGTAHTTVVQVRRDGVRCYLDGVLLRQHRTDYSDLAVDSWHETKDKSVLAIGCDDPTVFQVIQIAEVTGAGVRIR